MFETTCALIAERAAAAAIRVRVITGMSFLDVLYAELRLDPSGLQICNAMDLQNAPTAAVAGGGLVIAGVLASALPAGGAERQNVAFVQRWLDVHVPSDHPVFLVWTRGMPDYLTCSKRIEAADFTRECDALSGAAFASAYIPSL